jgi:hypothetical protein
VTKPVSVATDARAPVAQPPAVSQVAFAAQAEEAGPAADGQRAATETTAAATGNSPADESGTASSTISSPARLPPPDSEAVETPAAETPDIPTAAQIIDSIRLHFPAIREAIAGRVVASGEVLSATGAFDRKLDGYSENQPLDFYKNYRHSLDIKRDTFWGGQTFAGYRVGRGEYEPWYLERETNKGGEFKAGFIAPLAKDRTIDVNRAELWRAQLEQGRIEPEIRAAVIGSVRDGTVSYWEWIAAGSNLAIAKGVLQLGLDRTEFLEDQVEAGEKAQIDLTDNQRIIVSRRAKVIDAERKLLQSAQKLSLFYRNEAGLPIVLPTDLAPEKMPAIPRLDDLDFNGDTTLALNNRPELTELSIVRRQLGVALQQANNETIPDVDAGFKFAQDVGEPTSSKRDKSDFELEASLLVSVPLERRKALGKIRQLQGKLAQLRAKYQFAEDKIVAEVEISRAALRAAEERVEQTTRGLELAQQMQAAEGELYRLGQSTLLNLNLRELQTADAAVEQLGAQLDFYVALTDYVAALGGAGEPGPPPAP